MIPEDRQTRSPSYRAFIAYSHKDEAHARRLHRALEGLPTSRRSPDVESPQYLKAHPDEPGLESLRPVRKAGR